jgi:hypothetical protein
VGEQDRAQPAPLAAVGHRHGHLGGVRVLEPHEAGDPEPLAVLLGQRDERLVIVVVDPGQVRELALAEVRHRGQEAPVARLGLRRSKLSRRASRSSGATGRITIGVPSRRVVRRASSMANMVPRPGGMADCVC